MDKKRLGKRMRKVRLEEGMKLVELSERIGLKSWSAINDFERGASCPTFSRLIQIADALHVNVDYLLCDSLNACREIIENEFRMELEMIAAEDKQKIQSILTILERCFES